MCSHSDALTPVRVILKYILSFYHFLKLQSTYLDKFLQYLKRGMSKYKNIEKKTCSINLLLKVEGNKENKSTSHKMATTEKERK